MHLLFVCSGNTCRSPLALAAWRAFVREAVQATSENGETSRAGEALFDAEDAHGHSLHLAEIQAGSAGLCAHKGDPAATFARQIAREWGDDLENHRARLFRVPDTRANLILTMTESQADVLRAHFGLDETQVRVLGSYVPDSEHYASSQFAEMWGNDLDEITISHQHDILDPYGGSMEAYQECAGQIQRAVIALAHSLVTRK